MLILKDISVILIFEEMNYFQVDITRKKINLRDGELNPDLARDKRPF